MNTEFAAGMDQRLGLWFSWRVMCLTFCVLFLLLPFLFAYDFSVTSTCCDDLMQALNASRITYGCEVDPDICWLERCLDKLVRSIVVACVALCRTFKTVTSHLLLIGRQNNNRGLGFTIFDITIDKKFLARCFIISKTAFTALVTVALAVEQITATANPGPESSGAVPQNSTGQCCPC